MMVNASFLLIVIFALWSVVIGGVTAAFDVGVQVDPSLDCSSCTPSVVFNSGTKWVRFSWRADVATSKYQQAVQLYHSRMISCIIVFDDSTVPGAPFGGSLSDWNTYTNTFVSKLNSLVGYMKAYGNVTFEVWSGEASYAKFVPATSYAALLQRSYQTIKAKSSLFSVLMGSLSSGESKYLKDVLQSSRGKVNFDGIGLDAYNLRPSQNWPYTNWGSGSLVNLVAEFTKSAPNNTKLFVTQVGTTDTRYQFQFPQKTFEALLPFSVASNGTVAAALWFCWSDAMSSGAGLNTALGGTKQAFNSFRIFAKANS